MTRKDIAILRASKNLLLVADLTKWPLVEEILKDLYETGKKEGIRFYSLKAMKPVNQYDLKGNFIERFESAADVVEILGIPKSTLLTNLSGRCKKCRGKFKFEYVKKNEKSKRNKNRNQSITTG